MFPGQLNFFRFMADHETFAFTQRVLHRLQTDLDLQHLPAVRQGNRSIALSSGARRGQNDNVPSSSRMPPNP